MNKRIRELAEQAGYTTDMFGVGHWDMPECKKFAELIVRECINQCAHAPDVSEDWYQGVKWVANEIAQHFGVEE
jgi:hypothetical protein